MATVSKIRPSPIAGHWYSDNPQRLSQQIDDFLNKAQLPVLTGEVLAVVAPHAGPRYSGRTAAHAFRALQGRQVDLVVIVSPLHQYYPATYLTSAHQAYETPLGVVEVDRQAVHAVDISLRKQGFPDLTPIAYDEEHALEIELPFLQRALPGEFRLLPVMVRSQSPEDARALGRALSTALAGQQAALVASTDLSHFYPEPLASQFDREMLQQIAALDPDGAFRAERMGQGYACGIGALGAVLWGALDLGANQAEILHYSTSAEETGDRSSVVGYGAVAILKRT